MAKLLLKNWHASFSLPQKLCHIGSNVRINHVTKIMSVVEHFNTKSNVKETLCFAEAEVNRLRCQKKMPRKTLPENTVYTETFTWRKIC